MAQEGEARWPTSFYTSSRDEPREEVLLAQVQLTSNPLTPCRRSMSKLQLFLSPRVPNGALTSWRSSTSAGAELGQAFRRPVDWARAREGGRVLGRGFDVGWKPTGRDEGHL